MKLERTLKQGPKKTLGATVYNESKNEKKKYRKVGPLLVHQGNMGVSMVG